MVGLKQQYDSLSNDGFRVLAVATKDLSGKDVCSLADERDLVLRGYVAFLDPPKKTAGPALEALHQHGVAVRPHSRPDAPGRRRGEDVRPGAG